MGDITQAAEVSTLEHLRGGAGIAKKMGGKNLGLLVILLSLLYMPRAMSFCRARIDRRTQKIQGLGCGTSLPATNVAVLFGIGLVLANSRQFDRHGRSKFKMRLTGSVIIVLGMFLVFAHAGGCLCRWFGFGLFVLCAIGAAAQKQKACSISQHTLMVPSSTAVV